MIGYVLLNMQKLFFRIMLVITDFQKQKERKESYVKLDVTLAFCGIQLGGDVE